MGFPPNLATISGQIRSHSRTRKSFFSRKIRPPRGSGLNLKSQKIAQRL